MSQSKNPLNELVHLGDLGVCTRVEVEILKTILEYLREDSTIPVQVEDEA